MQYIFAILGLLAAVAIALGAYWHIYTAAVCGVMVWAIKKDDNN